MFEFPLWFIYVFIALISKGIGSFITKIIAQENFDYKIIFLIQTFLSTCILIFFIDYKTFFNFELIIFGFLAGLFLFLNKQTMVLSLKEISSSIVFINYRIFSSLILIFLGFIFLNESLTYSQLIGFTLGFFIFYLLYDKKDKSKKSSNFKKGIFYLTILIVIAPLLVLILKLGSNISVKNIVFYYSFFIFIFFLTQNIYQKNVSIKKLSNRNFLKYGIILSLISCITNYSIISAYSLHTISIIYKIFSFEIFIPIILSIIIYKEKISLRKIIAFILTIISIWFFL